ncbi:MAG TPA: hypothetical protein VGG39_19490 [Polyangiaceae bacterium]|jgi:hypothetical protein
MEIFQGPVIAPMHVTGLGGAYIASAEGTEGSAVNSAAPAVRNAFSTTWFDYDIALGISFPGAFTSSDFDNHGDDANLPPNHANTGNFTDLDIGATLQFGGLGVAAAGDLQQFTLTTPTPGQAGLTLQIGRWKGLAAYGLFDGQLAVGGGVRVVTMQVLQDGAGTLLTMAGASPEAGALLMPTGLPWRVGVTARAPVSGGVGVGFFGQQIFPGASSSKPVAGNLVLPREVVMPWEVEAGIAYQLGPRPLNPHWENPHAEETRLRETIEGHRAERARRYAEELAALPPGEREASAREQHAQERSLRAIEDDHLDEETERLHRAAKARYENWPREKILLLASVLMTGESPDAVSVEGVLDQRVETVGRKVSLTPRLGLEGEPVRNHMELRAGTYVEPSRYEGGTARQHVTFGTDVRLVPLTFWGIFPEDPWKLGVFVDLAPRYTNWGFGLGTWH